MEEIGITILIKELDKLGGMLVLTKARASGLMGDTMKTELAKQMLKSCKELENALEDYIKKEN